MYRSLQKVSERLFVGGGMGHARPGKPFSALLSLVHQVLVSLHA
jgi:hypothetical protein